MVYTFFAFVLNASTEDDARVAALDAILSEQPDAEQPMMSWAETAATVAAQTAPERLAETLTAVLPRICSYDYDRTYTMCFSSLLTHDRIAVCVYSFNSSATHKCSQ